MVTTITVSLEEHLVGCVRHLRHLKELDRASKTFQVLKVKIPPLKKKFVIPGKGMPKYIKKTSIVEIPVEYGDLVVNVCVNYPEKVNEAQIEVLSKFLPPPSVMEVENTGKSLKLFSYEMRGVFGKKSTDSRTFWTTSKFFFTP